MTTPIPTPYEDLLRDTLANGAQKSDRTGTGTRSVFGRQLRFDLALGFPLITTKRVHFRSIAYELLWFLRGDGNARWLQENRVTIWDEWADTDGNLVYSYTARNFNPMMATAGKITVAEVEELVPAGALDPNQVHTPGIFVQRIYQGEHYEKRIEQRTVRASV